MDWLRYQTLDFWYCRTSWYTANGTVMENSRGIQKSLYVISVLTNVMQARFKCLRLFYGCCICQWEYCNFPYFSLFSLDWNTHQLMGFLCVSLASCRPACRIKRISTKVTQMEHSFSSFLLNKMTAPSLRNRHDICYSFISLYGLPGINQSLTKLYLHA